jgi:hypothetical protein
MSHSPENAEKMKRFQPCIRVLAADEERLMNFIEEHNEEIEWD